MPVKYSSDIFPNLYQKLIIINVQTLQASENYILALANFLKIFRVSFIHMLKIQHNI
jgi:hypothetical protein